MSRDKQGRAGTSRSALKLAGTDKNKQEINRNEQGGRTRRKEQTGTDKSENFFYGAGQCAQNEIKVKFLLPPPNRFSSTRAVYSHRF